MERVHKSALEEKRDKLYYRATKRKRFEYNTTAENLYLKLINEIIYNDCSRVTCDFKDFLIFEDDCEFFEEFYELEEVNGLLRENIDSTLKNSILFPNYSPIEEGKYIFKNILRKHRPNKKKSKGKEQFDTILTTGVCAELSRIPVKPKKEEDSIDKLFKKICNLSQKRRLKESISTKLKTIKIKKNPKSRFKLGSLVKKQKIVFSPSKIEPSKQGSTKRSTQFSPLPDKAAVKLPLTGRMTVLSKPKNTRNRVKCAINKDFLSSLRNKKISTIRFSSTNRLKKTDSQSDLLKTARHKVKKRFSLLSTPRRLSI